jgi:hypothetical protein
VGIRCLATLVPFLLFSSLGFAQGTLELQPESESLGREQFARPFTVGTGYMTYAYNEPGVMKLHGAMAGLNLNYKHGFQSQVPMWIGVDGQFGFSTGMTYDGGIQDLKTHKVTPTTNTSRDSFNDVRVMYGRSIGDTPVSSFEWSTGLGRWDLNNKVNGAFTYGREIVYIYLPAGLQYSARINGTFTWNAGGEYDLFLGGSATSHFSDVSPGAGDIIHSQSTGSGIRFKAGGEWALRGLAIMAEAFYQRWDIDASDVIYIRDSDGNRVGLVEPTNNTSIIGLNVGARF